MPRVLLFSSTTGYQLRSYDEAAARIGVELVLATDRCHQLDDPWRDRAMAVRFHDVPASLEAIALAANEAAFAAVMSVGDSPAILLARAADRLGLPGNPPDAAAASVDKREARRRFADAGLRVPWTVSIPAGVEAGTAALDPKVTFPCVLKPLGLSGSRGVIRADDPASFAAALTRIRSLLSRPDVRARAERGVSDRAAPGVWNDVLVEGFIHGHEYAVEGVLTDGALQVFAIFDKPDPLDGPFFEETIYVTPPRMTEDMRGAIEAEAARGARALGLRHGPVHAELRAGRDGVFVLEIAARPIGGLCSKALRFEGGLSLEDVLLAHALGGDVSTCRRAPEASAVMMIPIPKRGVLKRVDGEAQARACGHVTDVRITAKPDQLIEPLPEAGSYLGFIFASAPTPEQADAAVRDAHAQLALRIDPAIDLVAR
jgi:biotin carboxylase